MYDFSHAYIVDTDIPTTVPDIADVGSCKEILETEKSSVIPVSVTLATLSETETVVLEAAGSHALVGIDIVAQETVKSSVHEEVVLETAGSHASVGIENVALETTVKSPSPEAEIESASASSDIKKDSSLTVATIEISSELVEAKPIVPETEKYSASLETKVTIPEVTSSPTVATIEKSSNKLTETIADVVVTFQESKETSATTEVDDKSLSTATEVVHEGLTALSAEVLSN